MKCEHYVFKRLYWCIGMSPEQGKKLLSIKEQWNPKKLSESKLMCVCVCFCQGELLLFYPWLWSCNRSSCPFSFIWLTAEPTLAGTSFSFLTFPFTFFFLNFIFLSSSPEIHHSSMQLPSVIFDLFGSVCLNQREGAEKYPDWCATL